MIVKPNRVINNALYYEEAKRLRLPVTFFPELSCMQIRLGGQNYYFIGTIPPFSNGSDLAVAGNKYLMNRALSEAGLPMVKAMCLSKRQFENFSWKLGNLKFPLVAKPSRASWGGEDVLCNIQSMAVLIQHLEECFKYHELVSIEEFHGGLNSYRVFVLKNKVLGVIERFPPRITGDGKHTIEQLMALENKARQKYVGKLPVADLIVDAEYRIRLEELGLTLQSIPPKGEVIAMCYRTNTLAGGTVAGMRVSDMHPENIKLALRAAKVLDLELVGLDIACDDLSKPIGPMGHNSPNHSHGFIIEANNYPDVTLHERPVTGPPNHVARKVLKQLIKKHPFSYAWARVKQSFGFEC